MIYLYNLYLYFVAFPILLGLTIFTAVFTMVFCWCPNAGFVHWVQMMWSRSFFFLMMLPVRVEGLENIRDHQSYVFVSNHQSLIDVWLIYGYLPVIFKWMMKKELRYVPFVGSACKAAGHVYVDRTNARAAARSMIELKHRLQNGICTVIFPEGTRTKTGQMARFKRGAFQIALSMKLPVVPISISGCYEVLPPHGLLFRRQTVTLHVGEPVMLEAKTREEEEELITRIHDIVESHVLH